MFFTSLLIKFKDASYQKLIVKIIVNTKAFEFRQGSVRFTVDANQQE